MRPRAKQARARASRVEDRGADVLVLGRLRWLDPREGVAKEVVEYVIDPCAAGDIFGGDINVPRGPAHDVAMLILPPSVTTH